LRTDRHSPRQDGPTLASVESHPYTEQVEVSDDLNDDGTPANYPRAVQTVAFVNPDQPQSIASLTAAARQSIKQALIKVGGFVAFSTREGAETEAEIAPRKRVGSIMDEVDEYLWEVYRRAPSKRDSTGDFTWKDPAAAKRLGMSMPTYVIGGMHPDFREQLYHAGRAMDAAGIRWALLSAFRDDYRQSLASGFKAGASNSLHGGKARVGGYGHGQAVDVTSEDGRSDGAVWRWLDRYGAKYGLRRPMPGADPAHIQPGGDWRRTAIALRDTRVGTMLAEAKTQARTKVVKASW